MFERFAKAAKRYKFTDLNVACSDGPVKVVESRPVAVGNLISYHSRHHRSGKVANTRRLASAERIAAAAGLDMRDH